MGTMNRFVKLNNSQIMPVLGLGTFMMIGDKLQEAVERAIHIGYKLFDTAYSYKNEADIGSTVSRLERNGKTSRKKLFYTTKVPTVYLNPKDVHMSVEESLENLRSKYVDLLLIHSPWGVKNLGDGTLRPQDKNGNIILEHYDIVETWKALEKEVERGRARSIGVSNFTPTQMSRIMKNAKIIPQNAQFECHAYLQQADLRTFCKSYDISCTSFGTLGSSGRPAHHNAGNSPQPRLLDDVVVKQVADKHGKTNSQILLRFMLQSELCVIPKSDKASRLEENFNIFDFHLDKTDVDRLRGLDCGLRYFPFLQYQEHPEFSKTGEPF